MDKNAAKKLHNKRERAKKNVNKSLPVAVLPFGDFILILAASKDHRRRIRRALDRIAAISFGSNGYDLQKLASGRARGQVFSEVSYENVTATSVAEGISTQLRHRLESAKYPQINGALILVRLDRFHPSGDEIVVLSYDGSMSFVSYFFSGTNDTTKNPTCECDSAEKDCARKCVAEESSVVEKDFDDDDDDDDDENDGMGRALPAFEEFIASTGPDNQFSVFDVVEKFGDECAVLFGEDIYVQCVQLNRRAAQLKQFDRVFEVMHGSWGGLRKEIRRFKKELKKQSE